MNRNDLFIRRIKWTPDKVLGGKSEFFPVSDAELAELGYVKRPVCDKCEGSGDCQNRIHAAVSRMNPMHAPGSANPHLATGCNGVCMSCGGTGYDDQIKR